MVSGSKRLRCWTPQEVGPAEVVPTGMALEQHCSLFDALSDDVTILILQRVAASVSSPRELASLALTCRLWRQLSCHKGVLAATSAKGLNIEPVKWLRSAGAQKKLQLCAAAGNREALFSLGMMLFYCQGRYEIGMRTIDRAGELGCGEAVYNLAVINFHGSGRQRGDRNLPLGVELLCCATRMGHLAAQQELGYCLMDGHGAPRQPVLACYMLQPFFLQSDVDLDVPAISLPEDHASNDLLFGHEVIAESSSCSQHCQEFSTCSCTSPPPTAYAQEPLQDCPAHILGGFHPTEQQAFAALLTGDSKRGGFTIPAWNNNKRKQELEASPTWERCALHTQGCVEHSQPQLYQLHRSWRQGASWQAPPLKQVSPQHPIYGIIQAYFERVPLPEGHTTCANQMCSRPETRKGEFRCCMLCKRARYCTRICQVMDWQERHIAVCSVELSLLLAHLQQASLLQRRGSI